MYTGWKSRTGGHSDEWYVKTEAFVERAFSLSNSNKARCPCTKCRNGMFLDKVELTMHLCRNGYVSHYELWNFHGETTSQAVQEIEADNDDATEVDMMDEMLEAIRPELTEDPQTSEIKYAQKVAKIHGADYDWENASIDSQAAYASGGGNAHGRFAIFDGVVESRSARSLKGASLTQVSSVGPSSGRLSQTQLELLALKEALAQTQAELERLRAEAREEQRRTTLMMAQMQAVVAILVRNSGRNIEIPTLPLQETPKQVKIEPH